jgi:hypothetical protein
MFDLARHERIRILFEDMLTGMSAEIDSLAAIHDAGVYCWVFEGAPTNGFILI